MKHKIIVGVTVAIVLVLSMIATQKWHDQKVSAQIRQHIIVAQQKAQANARAAEVKANYEVMNTGCHKGQLAYDSTKVKTGARPVCDLQIAE